MTAGAASPIPATAAVAASASPAAFPKAHYHPPYEDMIVSAIEALNDRRGSTTPAISNYIAGNYSGLAPTHPTLLTHHLQRLISKGVIRMLNFSYKLVGKKRGRPPKLLPLAAPIKKRKPGRPPKPTASLPPGSIYIIPQGNHLHSDILQNFPGAAAIVLPKSLLMEKTAKNSIIIFPNVIQSLIDASTCQKKAGRQKKNRSTEKGRRKPGRPKKNSLALDQNPAGSGDSKRKPMNSVVKVSGRPWKIRDMLAPRNVETTLTHGEKIAIDEFEPVKKAGTEETFRLNKRKSFGRPRKRPLIEGYPQA